jgi:predicted regulator of amino acid metabolism with ACT domain
MKTIRRILHVGSRKNTNLKNFRQEWVVARKIVELGLRVGENGKIYCGDVEINDVALARGAGVDRRSIRATVDVIMDDPELAAIFGNIFPAGALLKNVASDLGFGVVEIEAQAGTREYWPQLLI